MAKSNEIRAFMTTEQIIATYPIKEIEELAEQNVHYYLGAIESSTRSEQERLIRKVFTNGFMEAINLLSERFTVMAKFKVGDSVVTTTSNPIHGARWKGVILSLDDFTAVVKLYDSAVDMTIQARLTDIEHWQSGND
ncbi:MAG: hypothetical protein NC548_46190, partial [Lachnospiraceae bacterium]|nr:hypothetical protein [Lachnospiraceae bacterium]